MKNLFHGYDLMGFMDGTNPCPSDKAPEYKVWIRQDRLLLLAIQTAVTGAAGPLVSRCKTSEEAWHKLETTYANKSNTRMVGLIDSLTKVSQEGKSISDFMQSVKTIIDDLAMIGHDLSDGEIVVHTLNGLTKDYKEIKAALRARESPISFEELVEKLLDYETSLRYSDSTIEDSPITAQYSQKQQNKKYRNNNFNSSKKQSNYGGSNNRYNNNNGKQFQQNFYGNRGSQNHSNNSYTQGPLLNQSNQNWRSASNGNQTRVVCQLCDKPGHVAKVCRSRATPSIWPQANFTTRGTPNSNSDWIVDSGASHHITSDLQNLSIHSEYGGNDDIMVGDGNNIPITHTGFTTLKSCDSIFKLNNVLCAPNVKKNLFSVSQFCSHNNTSIEFFPDFFLVKDLTTGASLV